jgi:hypothetical protein
VVGAARWRRADNLSEDTKRFIRPACDARREETVGAVAAPTTHCESGDERPAREAKKSPGVAGAFEVRTRWGGGVGALEFAAT